MGPAIGLTLQIKAIPGARRDEVSGWLGERLKVRVSAPPEDGRANRAICELLARELGIKAAAVTVTGGHSRAEKVVHLDGVVEADVLAKWPRRP